MGLDMYLERETYIGANFKHNEIEGKIKLTGKYLRSKICLERVTTINERVGYWRKANAIHAWFIKHVQDDVDDCQRSRVPWKSIVKLIGDCEDVLLDNSLSGSLLPPQNGFFFGSTKVDEWYLQDLNDTIDIITQLTEDDSIFYQASW